MKIFELSPENYACHPLHAHDRDFRETNCYVDVWIEVLHALGLDPHACLAFTLASDFEGDQWTFFKPQHAELEKLYGVRVEELSLWRPLVEQIVTQVARRRLPLIEVDAYFLPDTAGSDYRKNHVKTTVAISAIDPAAKTLRYFHNYALHALAGEDYEGLLEPPGSKRADYLPPFCEVIKVERARVIEPEVLRAMSKELARWQFSRRPSHNPVEAHAARISEHMEMIVAGGQPTYHAYSFVAMRQMGASFELASSYLSWLGPGYFSAAENFARIGATAKMLILKLARVPISRKVPDLSAGFAEMASAWARGMELLSDEL